MTDPVSRGAKQALERPSDDPPARVEAERRELALLWHQVELDVSREEGFAEGRLDSLREVFGRILAAKFGEAPEALLSRVAAADEATLLAWIDRIVKAETFEAVFAHDR